MPTAMAWFGLSRRNDYILRSLICLARRNSRVPVHAIAACEHIPAPFLAKLLHPLTRHGLVSSKRGPGGGFALALPPGEIRVQQVLEISHVPAGPRSGPRRGYDFSRAWEKLLKSSPPALETLTLADLLDTEPAEGEPRGSLPADGSVRTLRAVSRRARGQQ